MKYFAIFILFLIAKTGFSQTDLNLLLPEKDSAQLAMERKMIYQQLLSGTIQSGGMIEFFDLPDFSFQQELYNRYNFNMKSIEDMKNENYSFSTTPAFFNSAASPFLRNGAIFSSASYSLNDKFTVGGYSFGANSVFSAPLPNQELNKFDTRGSTFFMQYKISKKVKIETRVSVSQGPGPGF